MRRVLGQVVSCLSVGFVTTILVAWGCATWIDVQEWDRTDKWTVSPPPGWAVGRFERPGVRWAEGCAVVEGGSIWFPALNPGPPARRPPWGWPNRFDAPPDPIHDKSRFVIADARGWPLPALWRELSLDPGRAGGAIKLQRAQLGCAAPLPLRPIFLPLLIDLVVHGMALFALVGLVRLARLVIDGWCARTRLIAAAACVLLGAITTVAVSWGLAARLNLASISTRFQGFTGGTTSAPGVYQASAFWTESRAIAARSKRSSEPSQPPWVDFSCLERQARESNSMRCIVGTGWPCVALWCGSATEMSSPTEPMRTWTVRGIEIGSTTGSSWWSGPPSMLPLGPIWSGLSIDTGLFALAWATLITLALSPTAVRRAWRRTHGRCEQCGYDLRGNAEAGCPECGWKRTES